LDFLEHVFGKVQGLLAFIRAGHTRASFEDRLHGVKTSAGVRRRILYLRKPNYGLGPRDLTNEIFFIHHMRCFVLDLGGCQPPRSSLSYRAFQQPFGICL
jgi:hypothetical protein